MHPREQTIFALSSGRPPSAIAIVRLSGPQAAADPAAQEKHKGHRQDEPGGHDHAFKASGPGAHEQPGQKVAGRGEQHDAEHGHDRGHAH